MIKKYEDTLTLVGGAAVLLLCIKFLLPLFRFDVPMGYDPGIYRYLFLAYADSVKEFSMPELLPWAQEYPPALFLLVAPFIILGAPVDLFLGAVWNIIPIAVIALLAAVFYQRSGRSVAIGILLVGLMSQAYFDGFYAMYWKTYAALFLVVLTYHLAENQSPWFILTALITVMLHQQTALIMVVALGVWWATHLPKNWNNTHFRLMTIFLGICGAIALMWYLPQWERAIWAPLKSIIVLRGENAPSGSFPGLEFYIRSTGVILLLGCMGFIRSFTYERFSLWQVSVIVCAVFVFCKLVFYKRFFLQLDFFLMPFAAAELVTLWRHFSSKKIHGVLVCIIAVQVAVSAQAMMMRRPQFSAKEVQSIRSIQHQIPEAAAVISLENISGTWLRGWLPNTRIGAPGLFDYPGWNKAQWATFIDGSDLDRKVMLSKLTSPVYFYKSDRFTKIYADRSQGVLNDPCLRAVENLPLLESICSPSS